MGFDTGTSSRQRQESGVPERFRRQASEQGLQLLQQTIRPLIDQFRDTRTDLQLSPFGLTPGTQRLFDQSLSNAIRGQTNRFSANLAARGLNRPENIQTLIDQSARAAQREVLPQFAPIATANERFQFQEPAQRLSNTIQLLQNLGGLFQGFTRGGELTSDASGGFGLNFRGLGGELGDLQDFLK